MGGICLLIRAVVGSSPTAEARREERVAAVRVLDFWVAGDMVLGLEANNGGIVGCTASFLLILLLD